MADPVLVPAAVEKNQTHEEQETLAGTRRSAATLNGAVVRDQLVDDISEPPQQDGQANQGQVQ